MKDMFLIMNPGANSGRSRKSFDKIIGLLAKSGVDFNYEFTTRLDDTIRLSLDANLNGYKKIVAVGGDGTINGVVNGFYDHTGHRHSAAKFGVIYTGTSPDFNKSYNIPVDIESAVKTILKGRSISIPVGMIQFETPYLSGKTVHTVIPEERYFVCCANIGLGATLARKANSGIRQKLGDFPGTLTALIGLLITFRSFPLNLIENNSETHFEKLTNLSIGITPYIASGIRVPVPLTESKNEFYRMVVQNMNLFRIIPLLRKVYSGKPFENSSYLSISYSGKLRLSSVKQVEVEADGDPVGHLPCTIRFAEDYLQLLVSR